MTEPPPFVSLSPQPGLASFHAGAGCACAGRVAEPDIDLFPLKGGSRAS